MYENVVSQGTFGLPASIIPPMCLTYILFTYQLIRYILAIEGAAM